MKMTNSTIGVLQRKKDSSDPDASVFPAKRSRVSRWMKFFTCCLFPEAADGAFDRNETAVASIAALDKTVTSANDIKIHEKTEAVVLADKEQGCETIIETTKEQELKEHQESSLRFIPSPDTFTDDPLDSFPEATPKLICDDDASKNNLFEQSFDENYGDINDDSPPNINDDSPSLDSFEMHEKEEEHKENALAEFTEVKSPKLDEKKSLVRFESPQNEFHTPEKISQGPCFNCGTVDKKRMSCKHCQEDCKKAFVPMRQLPRTVLKTRVTNV